MNKETIANNTREALSHILKAQQILGVTERAFNDTLTDENGKDIEKEYNSIHNALISLRDAERELIAS